MVAKCGRDQDLDILANDPYNFVRAEVAAWGRPKDLEVLKDDPNPVVQEAVEKARKNN